jgi:hypothetical protein
MVRDIKTDRRLYKAGQKRTVREGDFEADATVREGEECVIYDEQIAQDKVAWFGHGGENRLTEVVKHIYCDLVAAGTGTGVAGDPVKGDLVAVITDSKGRNVLARGEIDDLETLAAAADDSTTERPAMPAMSPWAKPGRRLQFRVFGAAASDGVVIDPAASRALLYYSES